MAFFILAFDEHYDESGTLSARLHGIKHSDKYPTATQLSPGSWLVVEPSTAKAKDVWMTYKPYLTGNVPLSVLPVSASGLAGVHYRLSDESDGWVQKWQLTPDKELIFVSGLA